MIYVGVIVNNTTIVLHGKNTKLFLRASNVSHIVCYHNKTTGLKDLRIYHLNGSMTLWEDMEEAKMICLFETLGAML